MDRLFIMMVVALVAVLNLTYASINTPPRLIRQPPTDEILFKVAQQGEKSDKPFMLECEAEGHPEPEYFWVKDGKNFSISPYDTHIQQNIGSGTLIVTRPRDEDEGRYQCFAQNEFGVATSNSVFVRKTWVNLFKNKNVKVKQALEGEPFSLICRFPDGWPKPRVEWLIQESIYGGIKSINNSRVTVDPDGTLWFSNVTRDEASSTSQFIYVCSVSSVYRDDYDVGDGVILHIVETGFNPAHNRVYPQKQYVSRNKQVALRGKRMELFCIYGGTPLPQNIWYKGSELVFWNDRVSQGNYGKSLIIKNVTFEDAGNYTCVISNGVGRAHSYSINLNVLSTPYFMVEPEIRNVAEEEEIEFRCEAGGIPEPTIQWIHNGKPIEHSNPNPRRVVETNRITIKNVIKADTGNYGCNATNSLGYVYSDVYLSAL